MSPSEHLLRFFEWSHLPEHLQPISQVMQAAANSMDHALPDGPEKSAGLRKLLEAKDCFVRAMLDTPSGVAPESVGGTPD